MSQEVKKDGTALPKEAIKEAAKQVFNNLNETLNVRRHLAPDEFAALAREVSLPGGDLSIGGARKTEQSKLGVQTAQDYIRKALAEKGIDPKESAALKVNVSIAA